MSNATSEEWAAALGAWNRLDAGGRLFAVGYIANEAAPLIIRAAASAAETPRAAGWLAEASTAIAGLNSRECREALSALAARTPTDVLAAIGEVTRG